MNFASITKIQRLAAKKVLLLSVMVLTSIGIQANEVIMYSQTFTGSQINTSLSFTVEDLELSSGLTFSTLKGNPFLQLEVDDTIAPFVDFTYTLQVNITPFTINGTQQGSYNKTLVVKYNPNSNTLNFNDLVYHELKNKSKIIVNVTGITFNDHTNNTTSSTTPANIKLSTGFLIDRYYELNESVSPFVSANNGNADFLSLSWSAIAGAESYDVEWTWVDNYSATIGGTLPNSQIDLPVWEFKNNSTRINTEQTQYKIPKIYGNGFLVFRVRAVGVFLDAISYPKFSEWSSEPTQTSPKVSHWSHVTITNSEPYKNWQFQASYAEEGKKKEVVSYFDGTLRNRQTVTKINTENSGEGLAIVGEVIYDNQGRPAVEILPVPANDNPNHLGYHPKFNRSSINPSNPYTQWDFDWESSLEGEECDLVNEGLSTNQGSGKYYSTNNSSTSPYADLVPSAQEGPSSNNSFPFSQIEYTTDNTGRIARKSGVGVQHQLESGHEMIYLYVTPEQVELDRLFGYSVGYNMHYKKNVVIDPNGQVSISYIDPQGRTIATALAGNSPSTLDGLPDEQNTALHQQIVSNILGTNGPDSDYDNNYPYASGNFGPLEDGLAYEGIKAVINPNSGHDFDYSLDLPEQAYVPYCFDSGIDGYPYVFQLTLNVNDNCNETVFLPISPATEGEPIVSQVGNYSGPATGGSDFPLIPKTTPYNFVEPMDNLPTNLPIGSYGVTKDLRIDENALNYFANDYINRLVEGGPTVFDCLPPIPVIEDGCFQDCEECVESLIPGATPVTNLANYITYYTTGDGYQGITPFNQLPQSEQDLIEAMLEDQYNTLIAVCTAPCTIGGIGDPGGPINLNTTSCSIGLSAMLDDVTPTGQYGVEYVIFDLEGDPVVTSTPETNVFNENNQLYDYFNSAGKDPNWRFPRYYDDNIPGSIFHYFNEAGEIARVALEKVSDNPVQYNPEVLYPNEVTEEVVGNITFYYTEPQNLLHVEDFLTIWEPVWVESLVAYHPEFCYYEYSEVLCQVTKDVTIRLYDDQGNFQDVVQTLNTDGYDNYLRGLSYADALHFGFISTENLAEDHSLYKEDPYFSGGNINILEALDNQVSNNPGDISNWKENIMNEAFGTDFDGSGYTLLESAYLARACNGIQTCTLPNNILTEVANNFSAEQQDEFWITYLASYQTLKQKLQYVFLNAYAVHKGCYNGCIEIETTPDNVTDVIQSYTASSAISGLFSNVNNGLCASSGSIYEQKTKRYIPHDVLYDSSASNQQVYNDIQQLTDLEYYLQTGKCPIMQDFEIFMDGLVKHQDDISNNTWNYQGQYMTPRIFEDFGGTIPVSGALPLSTTTGGTSNLSLSVNGLADVVTLTAPGLFSWNQYGQSNGWVISEMWDGYFTTYNLGQFGYQMKAKVHNIVNGNMEPGFAVFVVTGTTVARIGECELGSTGTTGGPGQTIGDDDDGDGIPNACDPCPNDIDNTCLSDPIPFPGCNDGFLDFTEFSKAGEEVYVINISLYPNLYPNGYPLEVQMDCGSYTGDPTPNRVVVEYNNNTYDSFYPKPSFLPPYPSDTWEVCIDNAEPPCNTGVETYESHFLSKHNFPAAVWEYDPILSDFISTGTTEDLIIQATDLLDNQGNQGEECKVLVPFSRVVGVDDITIKIYSPRSGSDDYWSLRTNFCGQSQGDPVVIDPIVCYPCIPEPLPPISCTDAYDDFVTYIATQVPDYDPTPAMPSDPNDPYYWDAVTSFCNMQFEYAVDGYMYYLERNWPSEGPVTSVEHTKFITLANFASVDPQATYFDYQIIIDDYVLNGGSSTWTEFANDYLEVLPGYCPRPAAIPSIVFPVVDTQSSCTEFLLSVANTYSNEAYNQYLNFLKDEFKQEYIDNAMTTVEEVLNMTYNDKEYQYTLYYYDQSGNLVKTVSPEGVDRFEVSELNGGVQNQITVARDGDGVNTNALPEHELKTEYKYNSLNQLVWQKTPDGGVTKFAYDQLGRIIASQNEDQMFGSPTLLMAEEIPGTFSFSDNGTTITKTGTGWAGGYGIDILEGNGYVSRVITDTVTLHKNVMLGLTYASEPVITQSTQSVYAAIDYKIYTQVGSGGNTLIRLYNGGSYTNSPYPFVVGDTLKVERLSGNINLYQNSTLLASYAESDPGEPMRVDFAMVSNNTKITEMNLVEYTPENSPPQWFSYTEYDALGRIVEAGSLVTGTTNYEISDDGKLFYTLGGANTPVNSFSGGSRSEVTRTFYDASIDIQPTEVSGVTSLYNSKDYFENYDASTARNRVSAVAYYEYISPYAATPSGIPIFDNALFYNYDIHGNVKELVHYYTPLEPGNKASKRHIKKVFYDYDLVSGNVHRVTYQKGQEDQFIHRYQYDADNRITSVETSKDGLIWEKDAQYDYYEHGPLARATIGDKSIQGQDYIYTLQGWLKSVNGEYIKNPINDFGDDGLTGSMIARDAFGYSLGYFSNDYLAVGSSTGDAFSLSNVAANNLFNGNIKQMVTSIRKDQGDMLNSHVNVYNYDQLNRIKKSQTSSVENDSESDPGQIWSDSFLSEYEFDRNGNLTTLLRNAFREDMPEPSIENMDDFTYQYRSGTNQLLLVNDAVSGDPYTSDLEDQETQIGIPYDENDLESHNYVYDHIGQLVVDRTELLKIDWRTDGKINKVVKFTDATFENEEETIEFEYDGLGNRITKRVIDNASGEITGTHYVRDAQGNVLSVYETISSEEEIKNNQYSSIKTKEYHLYGSDRLGIENVPSASFAGDSEKESETEEEASEGDLAFELTNLEEATWYIGNINNEISQSLVNYDMDAYIVLKQAIPLNDTLGVAELRFLNTAQLQQGVSIRQNTLEVFLTNQGGLYIPHFTATSILQGGNTITTKTVLNQGIDETTLLTQGMNFSFESEYGKTLSASLTINDSIYDTMSGLTTTSDTLNIATGFSLDSLSRIGPKGVGSYQIKDLYYRVTTEYNTKQATFNLDEDSGDPEDTLQSISMDVSNVANPWQGSIFAEEVARTTHFRSIGDRNYELKNHLGNVLSVVSDKRIPDVTGISLNFYYPEIKAYNDYYPYGMLMPARHANTSDYRYGFQEQEMDNEIKGEGNSLNYKYRMHDPRAGRFFAVDPLTHKYPWYSSYQFAGNKVIQFIELEGLEEEITPYLDKIPYKPVFEKDENVSTIERVDNAAHNTTGLVANIFADLYNASSWSINTTYFMISGTRKYDLYNDIVYPVEKTTNEIYDFTTETPFSDQVNFYANSLTELENYEAGVEMLITKKLAVSTNTKSVKPRDVKTQGLATVDKDLVDNTPKPIFLTMVFSNRGHQIASSIAKQNASNFSCVPCAQNIIEALSKEGIEYNILRIKSNNTQSFIGSRIFSKTKDDIISTNGYHYGIEVDGKVFDNIHTDGVDYNKWRDDFEIPSGGKVESVPEVKNN
ncbi:MAG: hypothetical protein CMC74_02880 [Flavobacteriaceae bacterium]|nr:hypothetical protein [Flavobacteriaceae bacterium]|tara:strand:- start:38525 stop:48727 length:10203 start_codon:yes stop_codon:yes gene_type:complete